MLYVYAPPLTCLGFVRQPLLRQAPLPSQCQCTKLVVCLPCSESSIKSKTNRKWMDADKMFWTTPEMGETLVTLLDPLSLFRFTVPAWAELIKRASSDGPGCSPCSLSNHPGVEVLGARPSSEASPSQDLRLELC